MGSVTFQFSGVCTHFRGGSVAGVPYRVVLPDATKVNFGGLQVRKGKPPQQPALYWTVPHFPSLQLFGNVGSSCSGPIPDVSHSPNLTSQLSVPGLLDDKGAFLAGARLQVLNSTNSVIDDQIGVGGLIPSLTTFYPGYVPSSDVVLNGRAACYLDLFGGCVWAREQDDPKPPVVLFKVETNGRPQLMVTPLAHSIDTPVVTAPSSTSIELTPILGSLDEDFVILVHNLEPHDASGDPAFDGGNFDYMLHYLTANGGIPEVVELAPPGLTGPDALPSATGPQIGDAMIKMGKALGGNGNPSIFVEGSFRLKHQNPWFGTSSPACADAMYP
jgi:hypothetical protein